MTLPSRIRPLGYNESLNVPSNILTTVTAKTVDVDTFITHIMVSGDIYAEWILYHDGEKVVTKRTGPSRNEEFVFGKLPFLVQRKESYAVKVIHYRVGETPRFECGVFGYQYKEF